MRPLALVWIACTGTAGAPRWSDVPTCRPACWSDGPPTRERVETVVDQPGAHGTVYEFGGRCGTCGACIYDPTSGGTAEDCARFTDTTEHRTIVTDDGTERTCTYCLGDCMDLVVVVTEDAEGALVEERVPLDCHENETIVVDEQFDRERGCFVDAAAYDRACPSASAL